MSTIFSKIIAGEIPSFKIYEDDFVFAFLDIFPQQKGHTLIIPKIEIDHFSYVPPEYLNAMLSAAQKISKALQKATHCARVCAKFEGFEVPHCHFHLIPAHSIEDSNFQSVPRADDAELADLQAKIIQELSSEFSNISK